MRQHFKQPTPKFAPQGMALFKHCLGRLGHHSDRFDPYRKCIEKPAEPAYRRRVRAKASARMSTLAMYQLGSLMSANLRQTMNRPGFVRRLFDPEGCAAMKREEMADWLEAKRNEKWKPRYHIPADVGRMRQAMKPPSMFGAA